MFELSISPNRVFDQCTIPNFNVDTTATISDVYVLIFLDFWLEVC